MNRNCLDAQIAVFNDLLKTSLIAIARQFLLDSVWYLRMQSRICHGCCVDKRRQFQHTLYSRHLVIDSINDIS